MNNNTTSQYMDKQIMDLSNSQSNNGSGGADFIDFMNRSTEKNFPDNVDSGKGVGRGLEDAKLLEKENVDQQIPETIVGDYRMPLVWIDLEMTGLNIEVDRILEISCVITNGSLTKSIEGPDLVINQPKECLDNMGEWCQEHHAESGLTEKVLQSTITEQEAEKQFPL